MVYRTGPSEYKKIGRIVDRFFCLLTLKIAKKVFELCIEKDNKGPQYFGLHTGLK